MYTACTPWVLRAQDLVASASRGLGAWSVPGRRLRWAPPVSRPTWRALVAAWREVAGDFDSFAVYQRRQADRGGLTITLVAGRDPVAVVKLRTESAGLEREQRALATVSAARPTTFSTPRPLGAGVVATGSDEETHWSAQSAVFTRPHRPVGRASADLFADVTRALSALATPGQPDPLGHGDLTPWNLRRAHDGTVWLFDWEDWGPLPSGTDRAYFALSAHSVLGEPMPQDLAPAALDHLIALVSARVPDNPGDRRLRDTMLQALGRFERPE